MPHVFFLFIILLTSGFCKAQQIQQTVDSLNALLNKHQSVDTVRLNLLHELSYWYYSVDPAKGVKKAEEAIQLATHLKHTKGLAIAYSRKGINHWARGEDSLAMAASNRSLLLYKEAGNWLSYAKGLNNRALNHYNLGDYIAAIQDHEEAMSIFLRFKDDNGIQHSYMNMGVVFLALDDYPRALEAFLHALRIDYPESGLEPGILTNIGLVYKNMEDYPKALDYQQKALEHYRKTGNSQGIANVLGNIATLYNLTDQAPKAIEYYKQALAINREIGNDRRIASDLTNIGIIYRGMGDVGTAAGYLRQAVDVYAKTNDKNGHSEALLQLAETYTPQSKDRGVLQLQALRLAEENGSAQRQSEALEALSHTYERTGDYQNALQAYRRHIVLQDSLFSEDKGKEVLRKQMEFDFEKKEALTQAEIRRQVTIRNTFLSGGSVLLLALLLSGFFYKRKRDAESRKKYAEHEAKVAETELKALRAQMNPHFIFNSLNAINDSLYKGDVVNARNYLPKFAALMRLTLEHSAQKEILLSEDLEFIEMYLEVEQLRLNHTFTYHIEVDKGIEVDNVLVPPMLLQPLVENSIWHGLIPQGGQGHILLSIRQEEELLLMCIEDNGVGMPSRNALSTDIRKSFGIRIIEQRLSILDEQMSVSGQLRVVDKSPERGVKAEIRLPLKLAF